MVAANFSRHYLLILKTNIQLPVVKHHAQFKALPVSVHVHQYSRQPDSNEALRHEVNQRQALSRGMRDRRQDGLV